MNAIVKLDSLFPNFLCLNQYQVRIQQLAVSMSRILLLLEQKENFAALKEWLTEQDDVLLLIADEKAVEQAKQLDQPFDLCLIDYATLAKLRQQVKTRREEESHRHFTVERHEQYPPIFLPFILIVSEQNLCQLTDDVENLVDEIIKMPLNKAELKMRLRALLRSRANSLQLQQEALKLAQTQNTLQESELLFRQLAENIHEIFWLKSIEQEQVLYISPAYETIYGLSCQSLYEQPFSWLQAVHREDQKLVREALAAEKQLQFTSVEFRIKRPDGTICWLWRCAFPVHNQEGQIYRVAGVIEDITERKLAELEVYKALETEKKLSQLKSRFVSMVSHEFRNPLNSISGYTQMLQRYSSKLSEPQKQEYLQRTAVSVEKMLSLLDDVLVLGQAGAGKFKFEPVLLNLPKLCDNLISEFKLSEKTNHQILFAYQGVENATVDPKLWQHICTNLLSNAVKYSPEGSTIRITVNCQPAQVSLQVQDEGIGIPEKEQSRLFESFYRASNVGQTPGTGLGLAIVEQCVELHGGAIACSSQEGRGTTFTVTIPLANSN